MICLCRFEAAVYKDYGEAFNMIYKGSEKEWLMGILRRELEVDNPDTGKVFKDTYEGQ